MIASRRLVIVLAASLIWPGFPAPLIVATAQESAYTISDIGWLVGSGNAKFDVLTKISPREINNDGAIVSNSTPTEPIFWAAPFTTIDGEVKRLGSQGDFTFVTGMNDAGDVIGYSTSLDDATFQRTIPTVWRKRKQIELPRLSDGGAFPTGINDRGQIVGNARVTPGGETHAVLWEDDEIVDLGTLGGANSRASAINDDGVIVGMSEVDGEDGEFPFVWRDGTMSRLDLPEETTGTATLINAAGTIAGYMNDASDRLIGIRWIDGEIEPLPALVDGGATLPLDINEAGQLVGWSAALVDGEVHYFAVLWDGEQVIDLNVSIPPGSGLTLVSAQAISDRGQILTVANAPDGFQHGVLLEPGG